MHSTRLEPRINCPYFINISPFLCRVLQPKFQHCLVHFQLIEMKWHLQK